MNNFSKKSIWFPRNEDAQDPKVKVADLIKLIDSNNIGIDLLRLMKVNTFEDEYINIPNAGSLVAIQKAINKKYHKEDLTSSSMIFHYSPQMVSLQLISIISTKTNISNHWG